MISIKMLAELVKQEYDLANIFLRGVREPVMVAKDTQIDISELSLLTDKDIDYVGTLHITSHDVTLGPPPRPKEGERPEEPPRFKVSHYIQAGDVESFQILYRSVIKKP